MGGQACVFYGAAQVSKDVDFLLLADAANLQRLNLALAALQARRIAVPPFAADVLDRGHAVHFRCAAAGVEDLRVDVMTRLRGVPDFARLWERRTVIADAAGEEYDLLCIPDLVSAKKTQRAKDWPVIDLLVAIHYRENAASPRPDWLDFWLTEARSVPLLFELATRFPMETARQAQLRPLLLLAARKDEDALREALDAEVRAVQAEDRVYWAPLKAELEAFRRNERETSGA